MNRSVSVFFLTSEVLPVVKTGGLADVSAALPAALSELPDETIDIRIGTLAFRGVEKLPGYSLAKTFVARTPAGPLTIRIFEGRLGKGDVPVYAVDPEGIFDRPGLYGEYGSEYPDNLERFSVLNHALLHLPAVMGFSPDIIHANDWQTALSVPLLPHVIRPRTRTKPQRTVISIHNMAFQGVYPLDQWHWTGLPPSYNRFDGLEYHGRLSLLKGGIQFSDVVTTVSPGYREEVLTEPGGFGLSGALRHRQDRFVGLLNGIDDREWDPSSDPFLPIHFSRVDPAPKEFLKQRMRKEWRLFSAEPRPLFGVVSRMAHQKGLDLLVETLFAMGREGNLEGDWAVLGAGDSALEERWRALHAIYPDQIHLRIGFDEALAHRIIGAADFLVVPSVYEPCGLTQMYAMRYGTLPVVNPTGGLRDTVEDGKTGIWLDDLSESGLRRSLRTARGLYLAGKEIGEMKQRAMAVDSSWSNRAREYSRLYRNILDAPPCHNPFA
ncbi:MAG: glycogen synthase [Nitrospirae bacterium]|nr:glycogen synthase [Nitrospirota bacterium]